MKHLTQSTQQPVSLAQNGGMRGNPAFGQQATGGADSTGARSAPRFFENPSSELQQTKTSTTLASRRLFYTPGSCLRPLPSILPQNSLEKYRAARALQGGEPQAFPGEAGAVWGCTRSP